MKALRIRTLILALLASGIAGCSGSSGSSSEISTFSKSYGGPLHEEAAVVLNTDDGGFMLFGSAEGTDLGNGVVFESNLPRRVGPTGGDFWLQELDANGNAEQSRLIGSRAPSADHDGTTWTRARPTADGGVILTGWVPARTSVSRPTAASREEVTTSVDIAVAKLDAAGNTSWRVNHDSGAWLNYDYFEANHASAAARDFGEDVWPMADGGYLVVGFSTANLQDRHGIGFPCDDAAPNDSPVCGQSRLSQSPVWFFGARSTIVLRLNADGSIRWRERLTEDAFESSFVGIQPWHRSLTVQGTSDGGAIVVRHNGHDALVYRLAAEGSVLWRRSVGDFLDWSAVDDFYLRPDTALFPQIVQTDDPVDGPNSDQYDGVRDDGFLLADRERVIKLDANGSLQWGKNIELQQPTDSQQRSGGNRNLVVNAIAQHCAYGAPTRCGILAVGHVLYPDFYPAGSSHSVDAVGFVAFLDQDGELRAEVYPPLSTEPRSGATSTINYLHSIRERGSGRFQLVGEVRVPLEFEGAPRYRRVALIDLEGPMETLTLSNERVSEYRYRYETNIARVREHHLLADGRVLLFHLGLQFIEPQRLEFFDSDARFQQERPLDNPLQLDALRTAAQISPNSFVLAGRRVASEGYGLVVLRYDLGSDGGRIAWQRRLTHDSNGEVLASVPSGDGGVVLSVSAYADEEDESRSDMLIKLDSEGRRAWTMAMRGVGTDLQRKPDGGLAVLWREAERRVVRHFSGDGRYEQWETQIWTDDDRLGDEAMTVTADGGLVVAAGIRGSRISLVQLSPDGALVAAADVGFREETPDGIADDYVAFKDLRVRRTSDGGFVLAATVAGLGVSRSPGAPPQPLGQSNVLVLKVDAAFQPVWSHEYGGLFDDGVRDLAVRSDGTIAVAGYSDSLGERREAWLLKLAPSGLVNDGCAALIQTIDLDRISATPSGARVHRANFDPYDDDPEEIEDDFPDIGRVSLEDGNASEYERPQDYNTARQCLGSASTATSPEVTRRLSVQQVGNADGVVTSIPTGISCGTGGTNICAANFAHGTRVTLRAEANRFRRWETPCEDGTGGESLQCVVTLDVDRVVEVNFVEPSPPPPPARFTLSFSVLGQGVVRTDDGINCTEGGSAEACSRQYDEGSLINVRAEPLPGQVFLGWTGGNDDDSLCLSFAGRTPIQIPMTRDVHCSARFVGTGERRLAVTVTGNGLVRDEPSVVAINCREGGSAAECEEIYTSTETVALLASADAGWQFDGWGGDCALHGGAAVISVVTAQSLTCSATFIPIVAGSTLTVQIVNAAPGRIVESQPAGINCSDASSDCSETFVPDQVVTLQATRPGFQSWSGCPQVMDINICRLTMNQSRTVTATYAP